MANQTVAREIPGDVIRIGHLLKVSLMARKAIFRRAGKHAIHVALFTNSTLVCASQGKGSLVMVEGCGFPGGIAVTCRAIVREICRRMVGNRDAGEIGLVATEAIARRALEAIVEVTAAARRTGMGAGERKETVVDAGALPVLRRVAAAAIG